MRGALVATMLSLTANPSLSFTPSGGTPFFETTRLNAKGFSKSSGGGGFGTPAAKPKQVSAKKTLKKIEQKYGGSSPQDIAAGTQRRFQKYLDSLPDHLQLATQLYQKLRLWDANTARLSILEQANIPPADVEGAERARQELERIYREHHLSQDDLHNIFQQATWDASADAKAARATTGKMPSGIKSRVERACDIVVESMGKTGICLDVGCGFGTLVPILAANGRIDHSQIYGVDISSEMVRNGQEMYPQCSFEAVDFLAFEGPRDRSFDSIIFCSALHDLPDAVKSLEKAVSLLAPGGVIVIVHAQGATHVNKQVQANPVLVRRALPTSDELTELATELGVSLVSEPAKAGTPRDVEEGYLAVLRKL